MQRKFGQFVFTCFFVSILYGGTDYTWKGVDSTWATTTNWDPNGVPGAALDDTVTFSNTNAFPNVALGGNRPLSQVTFNGVASPFFFGNGGHTCIFTKSVNPLSLFNQGGKNTIDAIVQIGTNSTSEDSFVIQQNSTQDLIFSLAITNAQVAGATTFTLSTSQPGSSSSLGSIDFQGANSLSSGSILDIKDVSLKLSHLSALGSGADVFSSVNLSNGALIFNVDSFSTSIPITLASEETFNALENASVSSILSGGGKLIKTGLNTLTLTGMNMYKGRTKVVEGTLEGNIDSLQGDIEIDSGATLVFDQASNGTFSSNLSGLGLIEKSGGGSLTLGGSSPFLGSALVSDGTLVVSPQSFNGDVQMSASTSFNFNSSQEGTYDGTIEGPSTATVLTTGSPLILSGSSSSFLGTVFVLNEVTVDGAISGTQLTVNGGAILKGKGTFGRPGATVDILGSVSPGNSPGTLTISGDTTFQSGSTLEIEVAQGISDLLVVNGMATLDSGSAVQVSSSPILFGFNQEYTILSATSLSGTFSSVSFLDPNAKGSLLYPVGTNSVVLSLGLIRPFLNFPFENANERSVGENLDQIFSQNLESSDLESVVDSMTSLNFSEVNDALDQLHPAMMGALADLQANLGGNLLSQFHERFNLGCSCKEKNGLWMEPFGNWLQEKKQGMQIGFHSTTRGLTFGYDHEVMHGLTIGLGGSWSETDLKWSQNRGRAYIGGLYGAFYSDLFLGKGYVGAAMYAGKDWVDTHRYIEFAEIDRKAKANYGGIDLGAGVKSAYFFGTPFCFLYPYLNLDIFYLDHESFTEKGAESLNLKVKSYNSSTLRGETGLGFRFIDRNIRRTICLSPFISLGYTGLIPLHRSRFISFFSKQNIPFSTKGRDQVWQLLNTHFGLSLSFKCFEMDSEYIADISPEGNRPLFNQRANFQLKCNF